MTSTRTTSAYFVPYGQGQARGLDVHELGSHGVELDRLVALGLPVVPGLSIPASHAQALVDCLEGVRVELFEGCGHYPHHEQPVAFLNALREFLVDPAVPRARLRSRLSPRLTASPAFAPGDTPLPPHELCFKSSRDGLQAEPRRGEDPIAQPPGLGAS